MHWLSPFLKKIVNEGFPTAFNFSHQFISTMVIKAYFNVVVDMKPICFNKCYFISLKIKFSKFTLYKLYKLVTKLVVKKYRLYATQRRNEVCSVDPLKSVAPI